MKRLPRVSLPGQPAVDGQIVTGSRPRWRDGHRTPSPEDGDNWHAQHVAEHGPHTCTPDPADPWSTCHLDSTKEETA